MEYTHEKYSERGIHMRSTQRGVYAQEVLREGYTHGKYFREGYTHRAYSERAIHMESTQGYMHGKYSEWVYRWGP